MSALLPVAWTEAKLLLREPVAAVFAFVFPPMTMLVLGGVFGAVPDAAFGGVAPTHYYVAAYLGVTVATMCLVVLPVTVGAYRERGVLRRFEAFGVAPGAVIASLALVTVGLAAAGCVLVVIAGRVAYAIPGPRDVLLVALGIAVATLTLALIGTTLGLLARSARGAQALGMMIFFPMYLLGGGGPPQGAMTESMRSLSQLMPLTHAIGVVQKPWLGAGSAWSSVAALLGWSALLAVGIAVLSRRRAS